MEVSSSNQANALSKITALGLLHVSVSTHGMLNYSKSVLSEQDLLNTGDKEILDDLGDQNVCAVQRIVIRKARQLVPTKRIIRKFNTPSIS